MKRHERVDLGQTAHPQSLILSYVRGGLGVVTTLNVRNTQIFQGLLEDKYYRDIFDVP